MLQLIFVINNKQILILIILNDCFKYRNFIMHFIIILNLHIIS